MATRSRPNTSDLIAKFKSFGLKQQSKDQSSDWLALRNNSVDEARALIYMCYPDATTDDHYIYPTSVACNPNAAVFWYQPNRKRFFVDLEILERLT